MVQSRPATSSSHNLGSAGGQPPAAVNRPSAKSRVSSHVPGYSVTAQSLHAGAPYPTLSPASETSTQGATNSPFAALSVATSTSFQAVKVKVPLVNRPPDLHLPAKVQSLRHPAFKHSPNTLPAD